MNVCLKFAAFWTRPDPQVKASCQPLPLFVDFTIVLGKSCLRELSSRSSEPHLNLVWRPPRLRNASSPASPLSLSVSQPRQETRTHKSSRSSAIAFVGHGMRSDSAEHHHPKRQLSAPARLSRLSRPSCSPRYRCSLLHCLPPPGRSSPRLPRARTWASHSNFNLDCANRPVRICPIDLSIGSA